VYDIHRSILYQCKTSTKGMITLGLEALEVDAFLADSVVVADGKLYVQGAGWDTLIVGTFPVRHSRLGIGAVLSVPWTATNQMHKFSVKIVDQDENALVLGTAPPGSGIPDGKVTEIVGQFNLGRPPFLTRGESQAVPIALNLDGLEFPKADTYSVVISINDTDLRRLPLRVRSMIQMPSGGFSPTSLPQLGS
jgi:hypothetical protein